MAKKPEPKEPKKIKPIYSSVDPVDRIPMIDYDKDEILGVLTEEKNRIDSYRSEWYERKFDYLRQWDNYLDYSNFEIIDGQKNVHIPVTHEKIQALHARIYKTIFSMDPIFTLEPLNLVSRDMVAATKEVLRWYLRNQINYRQGLKPFMDELIWDLLTDGWAIGYKRWETIQRKVLDLKEIKHDLAREQMLEALGELKKKDKISKNYEEVEKIAKIYSGIVLETVPHESVYFPDYIPTSGNLNHPKLVMIERVVDEDTLMSYAESGFYDKDAVNEILEKGKGQDTRKYELQRERQRLAGLNDYKSDKEGYPIFTAFLRTDLAGDKYPQEYIFTASLKAKVIARETYLDRVCRDGNRPIYKFDLLKRPRSAYSRGMVELLYPLNTEIDEFHNFRRAAGAIANMPWGFYRASSGLEKEAIKVKPGVFFPVDDPMTDVNPIQFGNVTTWAMQEEALAQTYADKLTSMPPMMQGQVPQMVGPLRSTSGVMALMQEASAPLDVYLDRLRIPIGQMISGILSDLQFRLPNSIKIMVLGENAELQFDEKNLIMQRDISKSQIMGNYAFTLAANDAQYNPERDKQNAMAMLQLAMSPFMVQSGITSQENAYWLARNVYEKNGWRDIEKYITKPQMAPKPQTLWQEYNSCVNGMMPVIVLNDDHKSKIEGLTLLSQSPEYQEAKAIGLASKLSDALLLQTVQTHVKYLQMIESLQNAQNTSGMEQPVTIGSRQVAQGPNQQPTQGGNNGNEGAGESPGMEGGGDAGEATQA